MKTEISISIGLVFDLDPEFRNAHPKAHPLKLK